jgi:DNA-binding NarL/FixJ family response regulator
MAVANLIRVLLVDDHALVRQGLRSALQSYPNIQVVGEAKDGESAVMRATQLQPTVVVMDVNMRSRLDGIMATQVIKRRHPQMVVLGFSVDPKSYLVHAMEAAGAFEVLSKDTPMHDLYGAIQRAVAAIQPILLLKDTSASDESAFSNPKDVLPVKEVTESESGSEH